ncbi:MAG: tRNA uridine-5-carboxymethylaminomethyl(34) synthesis GTPase MnmE [Nitrospiraceae bacterium]|nr:tRNA uridine-5-carboxymethylaminomethyl(34) synthesis GTPase MnmE [Nitrospiraceae bacterium]
MNGADTIAAISTPPGEGGIGIVRLSGPDAIGIASRVFVPARGKKGRIKSRRMLYGLIADPQTGEEIDEVLLTVMPAPRTYTREEMAEINCHGGSVPLGRTLELVLREGARLALPGEFTKRAFLNGRMDLTQAEAVLELIRAKSEEAGRAAMAQLKGGLGGKIKNQADRLAGICARLEASIDFPEEEIETGTMAEFLAGIEDIRQDILVLARTFEEGRLLRDGVKTAILGKPNVGKSSLLNALLGVPRAIVTEIPGTTRDVVSEYMDLDGHVLRIMDTAGIREAADITEAEGVRRSLDALDDADLVLCVLDGSSAPNEEDFLIIERIKAGNKRCILVINKTDLPRAWSVQAVKSWPFKTIESAPGGAGPHPAGIIPVSAKTGEGMAALKKGMIGSLKRKGPPTETSPTETSLTETNPAETSPVVTNIRHKSALNGAARALERAITAIRTGMPAEIVSMEVRDALHELGAITGQVGAEEILEKIFAEFCIGK